MNPHNHFINEDFMRIEGEPLEYFNVNVREFKSPPTGLEVVEVSQEDWDAAVAEYENNKEKK